MKTEKIVESESNKTKTILATCYDCMYYVPCLNVAKLGSCLKATGSVYKKSNDEPCNQYDELPF